MKLVTEGVPDSFEQVRVFKACLKVAKHPEMAEGVFTKLEETAKLGNITWKADFKRVLKARAGKYRILFAQTDGGVEFLTVGHRKEVYGTGSKYRN